MPAFSGTEITLGLMGAPIQQSQSPILHQMISAYSPYRLKEYLLLESDLSIANHCLTQAQALALKGVSVTMPLKQWAFEKADIHSEQARLCGMVNALKWNQQGIIQGHNTDIYGFYQSLNPQRYQLEYLNRHSINNQSTHLKVATILGAGGASRAIVIALLQLGVKHLYCLSRRTEQQQDIRVFCELIKQHFDFQYDILVPSRLRELQESQICVFTTPPLSAEEYQALGIEALPLNCLIYDLNYGEKAKALKRLIQELNRPYQDGLLMLCHQGIQAFEWFFELSFSEETKIAIEQAFLQATLNTNPSV